MLNKGLLWGLAYSAFSVASFGTSVYILASNSYDLFTFLQELTDNFRLTILLNFMVFCCLSLGYLSIRALFHRMRIIEVEHIADQLPFYGLNLLFILFNDGNLLLNTLLTGLTLLSKVHHIITYDRVDFLQVQVVNRMSQQQHSKAHVLAAFLRNAHVLYLLLLLPADFVAARILAYDVFQGIGSMGSLLFGIQFGVMGLDCFAFLGKLALNVYELVNYRCADTNEDLLDDEDVHEEHIWESRALYVQGFEILTSISKTLFYAVFLYTLYFHSHMALPIPLLQGCVVSIHLAVKQIFQLVSFVSQSRYLEDQLACPSEEDLISAEHMCIICREDMHFPATFANDRHRPLNPRKHPKKLQCGHILHLCCLKDWLERSDSCPLCRKPVFRSSMLANGSRQNTEPTEPPTPVDRPSPPTATSVDVSANPPVQVLSSRRPEETPTTASENRHGVDAQPETTGIEIVQENISPQMSPTPPFQPSQRDSKPVFLPKDWSYFPLVPTPEIDRFEVRLSASESARLTIRHRNSPN